MESWEYFEAKETRSANYFRFRKLRNNLCLRYVTKDLPFGVPTHIKLSKSETKPMIFSHQNVIFLLDSSLQ